MDLGDRIRTAREALGMSQEALAAAVGVDKRSVGNWERGEREPRSAIGALEAALGIQLRGEHAREAPPLDKATDAQFVAELSARLAERGRRIAELIAELDTHRGDSPTRWAARKREPPDGQD